MNPDVKRHRQTPAKIYESIIAVCAVMRRYPDSEFTKAVRKLKNNEDIIALFRKCVPDGKRLNESIPPVV